MTKVKLELLNLLTGFILVVVGTLNLYAKQYPTAASWIIFGSMYLVMDKYTSDPHTDTLLDRITQRTRVIFSWVGFIGSILLFIYTLSSTIY